MGRAPHQENGELLTPDAIEAPEFKVAEDKVRKNRESDHLGHVPFISCII